MRLAISLFLVAITFLAYCQVLDFEFTNYDDDVYVTENPHIKNGLTRESVIWAFTTSHHANWFPMTWLSHILDYQFYGLNPNGHHLTNLLFHIANTLLLFLVLFRMTGALWQSCFVAALFALHPFNVESVAWVAERKNVLSTFFWILTMWAYVHYVEKPGVKRYGLVALFFVLGLMSKPMLVTLPFVLLMMDYWPLGRLKFNQEKGSNEIKGEYTGKRLDIWGLVREKIPLFLLTAGLSITTFIVQKSGGALHSMEVNSLSARLNYAMVSYLEYVKMAVWPEGLAVLYPHPGNSLAVWKGILCGMALVGISIVSIRFIKKAPYLAFGWFWYLGTLVPVIQIVQTGRHGMADRYAYVPLIGIFIIVAWGLPELLAKWRHRDKFLIPLAGIYIPILMVMTWNQVSHWKNSITLFEHAISVTENELPGFALAHNNLGVALFEQKRQDEAIEHFRRAVKIDPNYFKSHLNLGHIFDKQKKYKEAVTQYKLAIKINPNSYVAYNHLVNTFKKLGKYEEAMEHYQKAIKINPDFLKGHNN